MNAFTQVAHRQQLDLDEPYFIGGENPCDDDIVGNAIHNAEFRARLDCPQLLMGICSDYEHEICSAETTIRRLEIGGLLETPEALCDLICAGVRSLAEGAR